MAGKFGTTEPARFTPPLRELTAETTRGFEFAQFCQTVLGIELYPWQKWLANHALELLEDGTYRYQKVLVVVSRQNGKTMLAACLAAWWLFMDYAREPGKRADEFVVLGAAQNLNIAEKPFMQVRKWCDPKPSTVEEKAWTVPALAAETLRVRKTNGNQAILTRAGCRYMARDGGNARGETAARVLLDELREQKRETVWNAVEAFPQTFANGQIWAISSGAASDSVVMKRQLKVSREQAALAAEHGDAYLDQPDADPALGLFEWAAPDGCDPLDEDAILAANPSIGYSNITVDAVRSKYRTMNETAYRAEFLCQTVEAKAKPYIDPAVFRECIARPDSYSIAPNERTVWAVDTSADRKYTSIAGAVMCEDGVPLVALVREPRLGMMWLPEEMANLAREASQFEVMVRERGCPAMEFRQPLEDYGLQVRPVQGSWLGVATGQLKDAIVEGRVRFADQAPVAEAIAGGITRKFGDTDAWNLSGSPVDISPLIACTLALYGLSNPVDVPLSAYEERSFISI